MNKRLWRIIGAYFQHKYLFYGVLTGGLFGRKKVEKWRMFPKVFYSIEKKYNIYKVFIYKRAVWG